MRLSAPGVRLRAGRGERCARHRLAHESAIAGPFFFLAPPQSFSSVVCEMLGQHPQMFGLPELHLLDLENVGQWFERRGRHAAGRWLAARGGRVMFGGQTEETVRRARGWLWRRAHFGVDYLVATFARIVQPRMLVEKSPSLVLRRRHLQRVRLMFPDARFIQLVGHPRGQGESVLKLMQPMEKESAPLWKSMPDGPFPPWVLDLASAQARPGPKSRPLPRIDPQQGWLELHRNICEFLDSMPQAEHLRVRGEDLLSDPDTHMKRIAGWLGLRTDPEAIEAMKHREKSVFACRGPRGAVYGNDRFFIESPILRPVRMDGLTLDGPLRWRDDDIRFSKPVRQLARRFGYQRRAGQQRP
jgi:hypothetical protein